MEGSSNGGMLYHEVQESKLCAVHCVNTVLQGPFFSEFDLAAVASDLDSRERQMMLQAGGDFLPDQSHNVSMGGDFSIQVLEKALEVWGLQIIPLNSPVAEPAQIDPELENAFICHLQDHWFCIRKVNGEWYNFDSLYAAPEHLSKFYLSAYLSTLKGSGWSIFLVRGNFPKECPLASSEASNGYGQWLLPEDAERIIKSCNTTQRAHEGRRQPQQFSQPYQQFDDESLFVDDEDEDLRTAIMASLRDTSSAETKDSSPEIIRDEAKDSSSEIIRNEVKDSSREIIRNEVKDSSPEIIRNEAKDCPPEIGSTETKDPSTPIVETQTSVSGVENEKNEKGNA
ncbi:chromatin/chromatin-binding, or -regulatory protein [Lithospermum erythrorhizon]|uniref:ubiquitinyl hydrolase 1 n=1 Tax=Lithospermum erythrorhizon TaxID=34254 RepID=A0AAV3NXQ2_LITER